MSKYTVWYLTKQDYYEAVRTPLLSYEAWTWLRYLVTLKDRLMFMSDHSNGSKLSLVQYGLVERTSDEYYFKLTFKGAVLNAALTHQMMEHHDD